MGYAITDYATASDWHDRHFPDIAFNLARQPSVVSLNLAVQRSRNKKTGFGMTFQYRVVDGATEELNHYGLELARLADLPEDVLVEGREVAEKLAALHTRQEKESESGKISARRRVLLRVRTQLCQALDHSLLPEEDLLDYVGQIQKDMASLLLESA